MSDLKLSEFLAEHRASEFGLAPVSKAMAIKMAKALETKLKGRPSAEQFAIVLEDRRKAEERVEELEAEIGRIGDAMIAATKET